MKHLWIDVDEGVMGIFSYGKRKCQNCGVVQTKEAEYNWMRITCKRWLPLVGRCKGKDNHGKA